MIEPAPQNPLLDAALAYATRGWYVFATHDVSAGRCSCGTECASPGKHPRTAHGLKDATIDPDQIRRMWAAWPSANVAIDCGRSNLIVADVDVKKGAEGAATLRWFLARPELPFRETRLVVTPTGGYHFYFSGTTKTTHGVIGAGVDVQSEGAYVLAPPSRVFGAYDEQKLPIAGSQGGYNLLEDRPLQPFPAQLLGTAPGFFRLGDAIAPEREGDARVAIPHGEHRQALLWLAWHLRRVHGLETESALPLLEAFISSGALEGYNPRQPFTQSDLRGMLARIEPQVAAAAPQIPIDPVSAVVNGLEAIRADARPVEWLLPYFVPRGELVLLYGAGGVGKSSWVSWLAAHVTTMGRTIGFIGVEEPLSRFAARALVHGANVERIIGPQRAPLGLRVREHTEALRKLIVDHELSVLYIDALRAHFVTESRGDASTAARENLGPLASLAQETGCTILGTFHENKAAEYSGSTEMRNVPRVLIEAKSPRENLLHLRIEKSNFTRPPIKLAFERSSVPEYSDGKPAYDVLYHPEGIEEVQRTLPKWTRIADVSTEAFTIGEVAGDKTDRVRKILLENPNISMNAIFKEVGGNRPQMGRLIRDVRDELGLS